MRIIGVLVLLVLAIISLAACGNNGSRSNIMQSDQKKAVEKSIVQLSGKKIFFGHQSVGFNIIDGIGDLFNQTSVKKLNIMETRNPADFNQPVFAHAKIGANCDPSSKLADFEKILFSGVGDKVDMAFFKFCYVDITAGSDVEKIFREYAATMSQLKKRYPKVTFVHITVPLTTINKGLKAKIKTMIGRGNRGDYDDNIKRNEFNSRLINEYGGKEPVFDLASIEATAPDGRVESFSAGGKPYTALYPAYSSDGGHLNENGRRKIAEKLLQSLSSLQ